MTGLLHRLVAIRPLPPGSQRVAVRAGISVLVPLLILLAIDHLEWSLYATFGAFTSLYGRERVDLARVVRQASAGLGLVLVVTVGAVVAVSDQRQWLAVPIAAVVAIEAAYVSARWQWIPPGSLFQVFGFAAVASVPAAWSGVLPAVVVATGSALISILVGNIGAAIRRVRRTAVLTDAGPPIGGVSVGVWRYAIESGVGVALAGAAATASGIGRPYWAMVSAVVPLVARDLSTQLVRGLHRVIGTGVGLLVAWVLLELGPPSWATILIVAALQLVIELLVARNYALALMCITPLALLMVHMVAPIPIGQLLADRGAETVIGVVIGLLVGYAGSRIAPRPEADA
ncbi:MAG: FUSC family protein [Nocardioides sp.]|uniref:FUSC family protein n=1 Tax=Nocardioides sp. TaxID=35761 RepID=UPI0039E3584B